LVVYEHGSDSLITNYVGQTGHHGYGDTKELMDSVVRFVNE
jgi:hypothetical protein